MRRSQHRLAVLEVCVNKQIVIRNTNSWQFDGNMEDRDKSTEAKALIISLDTCEIGGGLEPLDPSTERNHANTGTPMEEDLKSPKPKIDVSVFGSKRRDSPLKQRKIKRSARIKERKEREQVAGNIESLLANQMLS